jgi:phospholipid N-methyltransferase
MPSSEQREQDRWLFLRKFLKYGKRVASVAPSSPHLARAVCEHITPTHPQTILELGAGTGAVTTIAARRMHPDSTLLALELDPDFARILRQCCPQAHVIEADATTIATHLQALGIAHVDVVLSGLPTPSLPPTITLPIFETLQAVARTSYFSQLTVIPWLYLGMYRRLFHEVTFRPVWLNIPCGGVYHCRRLRSTFARHLPGQKKHSTVAQP